MRYLKIIMLTVLFPFMGNDVAAQDCLDFSLIAGTEQAMNSEGGDTEILSEGNLKLIKTYQTFPEGSEIISISNTEINYLGHLTIDVSSAMFNCRELSFIASSSDSVIIDGDIISISDISSMPVNTNKGYIVSSVGNKTVITGSFNEVIVYDTNVKLSNVCLKECVDTTTGDCQTGHFSITPNDDGNADYVLVKAGSSIYNRNGFLVLKATQDMNWKGIGTTGEELPIGYYTILCKEGGSYNVTVIR